MNFNKFTESLKNGYKVSANEALELYRNSSVEELSKCANELRNYFDVEKFDTCSIVNARSGRCPENCKWCSQSKFHTTNIDIYPLLESDKIIEMAKNNALHGVGRYSLVTSGRKMSETEVDKVVPVYKYLSENVDIELCASMGLLLKAELKKLYDAGCTRYHCNLETAPSYFSTLCTTHTINDKIRTITWAREVGMSICSGGIIGMGESDEQRIELAISLRELDVDSIPVNVLNPIVGTPLEGSTPLSDDDILKSIAIFKIIHPRASIRFAGGRTLIMHIQERAIKGGVSAAIVGDMLTTLGIDMARDMEMLGVKK